MSHIREVPEAWKNFLSLEDTPAAYVNGQFLRATAVGVELTADVVQKTGSTMSGFLTLSADPTNPLHAATKQYVDSVATGLDVKESVRVATTENTSPAAQSQETVHTGPNGVLVSFASADGAGSVIGTLPVSPNSVTFTATIGASPYTVTDNGSGVLSGSGPTGAISGTINYATGAWTIDFDAADPPDDTTDIVVDYSVPSSAITLSGLQTIDGVSLIAGDRVLVKDQGTGSPHADNGIYVVASGAWTRAEDADSDDEFNAGMFTFIEEGTDNGNSGWVCTTDNPITVGTTPTEFAKFSSAGDYAAGEGLTLTGGNTFNADWETNVGNIQDVGTAAVGTSTKIARADHVHAHGTQGGGTQHSEVTTSVAGFMSATDKTKLDGIDANAEVNQNAWSIVDINAAETVLNSDAKTDTLYLVEANVVNIAGSGTDTVTIGLTAGTNGQLVKTVGGVPTWAFAAFLELSDTPATYAAAGGHKVRVNSGATALEFIDDTLLSLDDTPSSYAGVAGYRLVVNSTPDAVEFIADTFINLSDTPASYSGEGLKLVRVNTGETALEFVTSGTVPATATLGQTLYWNSTAWTANSLIFNDFANLRVGINTAAPHSTLHVNGSFAVNLTTFTATVDLGVGTNGAAKTIIMNNAAAATITLPSAVGLEGREYDIKKVSATGGGRTVTIDGAGTETIDGSLTFALVSQYEAITVISDGANWWIV